MISQNIHWSTGITWFSFKLLLSLGPTLWPGVLRIVWWNKNSVLLSSYDAFECHPLSVIPSSLFIPLYWRKLPSVWLLKNLGVYTAELSIHSPTALSTNVSTWQWPVFAIIWWHPLCDWRDLWGLSMFIVLFCESIAYNFYWLICICSSNFFLEFQKLGYIFP